MSDKPSEFSFPHHPGRGRQTLLHACSSELTSAIEVASEPILLEVLSILRDFYTLQAAVVNQLAGLLTGCASVAAAQHEMQLEQIRRAEEESSELLEAAEVHAGAADANELRRARGENRVRTQLECVPRPPLLRALTSATPCQELSTREAVGFSAPYPPLFGARLCQGECGEGGSAALAPSDS